MSHFTERPEIFEGWEDAGYKVLMAGMGDDTAMLIAELYIRGYEPDEIVFCDTGTEHKRTYDFIAHLQKWVESKKWSKLTVLKNVNKKGEVKSVIGEAEKHNTLPAAAFGSPSCSQRFKTAIVDKYLNNKPECHDVWGISRKGESISPGSGYVLKLIGINADEERRTLGWKPELKFVNVYPLVDWDVGEKCSSAVEQVGLYYPGKSSCYCCPHMTGKDLFDLHEQEPENFKRIVELERAFIENNAQDGGSTRGMCRSRTIKETMEKYKSTGVIFSSSCDVCSQ